MKPCMPIVTTGIPTVWDKNKTGERHYNRSHPSPFCGRHHCSVSPVQSRISPISTIFIYPNAASFSAASLLRRPLRQ